MNGYKINWLEIGVANPNGGEDIVISYRGLPTSDKLQEGLKRAMAETLES